MIPVMMMLQQALPRVLTIGLLQVQAGMTEIPHLHHGKTDVPQANKFEGILGVEA
jgi:hypothetical protein